MMFIIVDFPEPDGPIIATKNSAPWMFEKIHAQRVNLDVTHGGKSCEYVRGESQPRGVAGIHQPVRSVNADGHNQVTPAPAATATSFRPSLEE